MRYLVSLCLSILCLNGCVTRVVNPLNQIVINQPKDNLQAFFVEFGAAFGPDGIKHFSELSSEEQRLLLERVPVLKTLHTDWEGPLKNIPRTWTTWVGGTAPVLDSVVTGRLSELSIRPDGVLYPIPACGDNYVIRGYIAATTTGCLHSRIGWRWDDIDLYWSLDWTIKKVGERDIVVVGGTQGAGVSSTPPIGIEIPTSK